MRTSDTSVELFKAIIEFQKICPQPKKLTTGHNYQYADLDEIWHTIKEPLNKCDLAVIQSPLTMDISFGITTRIVHKSGEWMEGHFTTKMLADIDWAEQSMGTIVTYFRRYGMCCMLGLFPEADTDGVRAGKKPAQSGGVQQNYGRPEDFKMPFGKSKGKKLSELPEEERRSALMWCEEKDPVKFAEMISNLKATLQIPENM